MLSRAAAHAVKARGSPASLRIAPTRQWARTLANDGKRRRDWSAYKTPKPARSLDSSIHKPQMGTGLGTAAGKAGALGSKNGRPETSDQLLEQDEMNTEAISEQNSVPQTKGAGPGTTSATLNGQNRHPDYSKYQDEFQTDASAEENTAPQNTSTSAIDPALTKKEPTDKIQAQDTTLHDGKQDNIGGQKTQLGNKPLPDLTQGIPSTLDAELSRPSSSYQADKASLKLTGVPPQASGDGSGKGSDFPRSTYVSSIEERKYRIANFFYAAFAILSVSSAVYLGRNWETEEEERAHLETPSGWGFGLFYNRARARLGDMLGYYTEPVTPKLLPDPQPEWERPYTLVLSLEDLLIHSEWSREHGWRMAKRPGVDYFLRYLSQYYELVVFTSVPSFTGDPVMRKLDPYRIIMWPLFREATRYSRGEHIKDLSLLNRDLSKVIMLDTNPAHVQTNPENAIILPKWKGDKNDRELVSYIPILEYTAAMALTDTREVLKSFNGKHIPTEFAHREAMARKKFEDELAEDRKKRPKRSGVGFLGSMLGIKPPVMVGPDGVQQSATEAYEQGKMLSDQIREQGQKNYEMLEKQIKENGEKMLQEWKVEEDKMKEEQMKGMKMNFGSFFGGQSSHSPEAKR
ncbi:MAG: mitochondrial inner membrane protein required for protein import [Candelina submexicana]|nr:MAG: mitochondrial inner membrane protein required for protein import [Candelina submexicana]